MEFPNLGSHCDVSDCRMLGCRGVFCKDHFYYSHHNCPSSYLQDNQVPVCPLCGVPVPVRPGESPDSRVGDHIDTACRSKPARELKGKLFNNSCCVRNCKKKEAVPFICPFCQCNYCISHRNELDHNCKEKQAINKTSSRHISQAGAAAVFRAVFSGNSSKPKTKVQPSKTVQLSKAQQEEEDRQLALALAASYADNQNPQSSRSNNGQSCTIS